MGTPPPIHLDTFSMPDTLILMVLALVVFGPRRLPMIGRQLGKLMYEFRKASNDFKFQMEEELRLAEEADRRKKEEEERQRALAAASAATPAVPPALDAPVPLAETATAPLGADQNSSEVNAQPGSETPVPAAETAPRILPPSTGETVAAERPGPSPEAATQAERSEPAAHHG